MLVQLVSIFVSNFSFAFRCITSLFSSFFFSLYGREKYSRPIPVTHHLQLDHKYYRLPYIQIITSPDPSFSTFVIPIIAIKFKDRFIFKGDKMLNFVFFFVFIASFDRLDLPPEFALWTTNTQFWH